MMPFLYGRLVVDEQAQRPVVLCVLLQRTDGSGPWLYHLAVHPGYRRRGIARLPVSSALSDAAREHVPVRLTVSAYNHAARRLYYGLGFRKVADAPSFVCDTGRLGEVLADPW